MNIRIYQAITDAIELGKSLLIYDLSNSANLFFKHKHYGEDVKNIEIGFLMILERPGYENWYKAKMPKYTDYKKTIHKLTGEVIEIHKTYKYEIKLSEDQYYAFTGSDDTNSKIVLTQEILKSLSLFDKMPAKIKDFDKEKFTKDLMQFFKSQYLVEGNQVR